MSIERLRHLAEAGIIGALRDGESRELATLAAKLTRPGDEESVIDLIRDRLTMGRLQYGPLRLAADKRNWKQEARDEVLDCLVYMAAEVIQLRAAIADMEAVAARARLDTIADDAQAGGAG